MKIISSPDSFSKDKKALEEKVLNHDANQTRAILRTHFGNEIKHIAHHSSEKTVSVHLKSHSVPIVLQVTKEEEDAKVKLEAQVAKKRAEFQKREQEKKKGKTIKMK